MGRRGSRHRDSPPVVHSCTSPGGLPPLTYGSESWVSRILIINRRQPTFSASVGEEASEDHIGFSLQRLSYRISRGACSCDLVCACAPFRMLCEAKTEVYPGGVAVGSGPGWSFSIRPTLPNTNAPTPIPIRLPPKGALPIGFQAVAEPPHGITVPSQVGDFPWFDLEARKTGCGPGK
jgi:hypothetical protein